MEAAAGKRPSPPATPMINFRWLANVVQLRKGAQPELGSAAACSKVLVVGFSAKWPSPAEAYSA
jgi:hypothetical protein